jgi:hypothetical protein
VQTWGIQFERRINRLQESSVFAFTPRGERGGVARYGTPYRSHRPQGGKRTEVMPTWWVAASSCRRPPAIPSADGSEYGRGTGLDALYRVTTA